MQNHCNPMSMYILFKTEFSSQRVMIMVMHYKYKRPASQEKEVKVHWETSAVIDWPVISLPF